MEKYKPIKSTRKNKKYMILTDKGLIHFGDTRFQNFRQHGDKKRQEAYCKRAKAIRREVKEKNNG